jgi:hypothetical protein
MSGRKINDYGGMPHSSDMAMKSKNSLKHFSSAEGSGAIDGKYPDTTEDIKRDQLHGDSKIKGRPMKEGFRY